MPIDIEDRLVAYGTTLRTSIAEDLAQREQRNHGRDRPRRSVQLAAAALASAAFVGIVIVNGRDADPRPTAPNTSTRPAADSQPASSTAPATSPSAVPGLAPLADPSATRLGGLVKPLLPAGFVLAYAGHSRGPYVAALNAEGDRLEVHVYSGPLALKEVERLTDQSWITYPEGRLAAGANGQPDDRNAYLVSTEDAIVTVTYARIRAEATIVPGTVTQLALAVARGLNEELLTRNDVTQPSLPLADEVSALLEDQFDKISVSGGADAASTDFYVSVQGTIGGAECSISAALLNGYTGLPDGTADGAGRTTAVRRIGTWESVVTIEGDTSCTGTMDAVEAGLAARLQVSGDPSSTTIP